MAKIVKSTEINTNDKKVVKQPASKSITLKDLVPFNRTMEKKDFDKAVDVLKHGKKVDKENADEKTDKA